MLNKHTGRILALLQGFFFVILLVACNTKGDKYTDTPTTGTISIGVDESFQPLIQAEVDAFMANYKYANVNPLYQTEGEVVKLLLEDSVRLIVITRQLTNQEKAFFQEKKITPRTLKIATDAVAIIVNAANQDTLLTVDQLASIFKGNVHKWNELNGKGLDQEISIVFDNSNSSNLSYIKNKFSLSDSLDNRIFAAKSNQQVIEYVEKNARAMGVIGVNWISDTEDDPRQMDFINRVRVVAVADTTNPGPDDYYQPYQAYLALKKYPLHRDLYIISREARTGLGTGFASFVAGDKGQLVVLKGGLLPATMPIRLVELKNQSQN
jgi:phosphate transport system substrate-binding protein